MVGFRSKKLMADRYADPITLDHIIELKKQLAEAERQRDNALSVVIPMREALQNMSCCCEGECYYKYNICPHKMAANELKEKPLKGGWGGSTPHPLTMIGGGGSGGWGTSGGVFPKDQEPLVTEEGRLREALKECAADFTTKSSDHRTAAQEILDEFERRALIARAALKGEE